MGLVVVNQIWLSLHSMWCPINSFRACIYTEQTTQQQQEASFGLLARECKQRPSKN